MFLEPLKIILLAVTAVSLTACDFLDSSENKPNNDLKVVIIRHAEKAKDGDNLSCQGQNRALQLASVLHQKINKPDFTYVPALKLDKATKHSRMFQTVTPFAVKYDLTINSKYAVDDYDDVAKSVLKKQGTVLMVWSHSEIPNLLNALGVDDVPEWSDADFDTIWTITYDNGKVKLALDQEGLKPSTACIF
jgi:outer membrane lipopolysaccharide assembly protein LptE/RlpB